MERVWESNFYTPEEAFARFQEVSEQYGHLDTVSLIYLKGSYDLFYCKPKNN